MTMLISTSENGLAVWYIFVISVGQAQREATWNAEDSEILWTEKTSPYEFDETEAYLIRQLIKHP